jgi:hypothetical protein
MRDTFLFREISLSAPSWNSIREFKSNRGSIDLKIKLHGGFEYEATRRLGQWKQRPDLVLELTSRQQKKFVHYGSYGTGDIVVDAPEVKYEFIVYRQVLSNFLFLIADLFLTRNSFLGTIKTMSRWYLLKAE